MSDNNNNTHSGYHPDTVLLMADGTTRQITEVVPGDLLMGVTGNPIRVTECLRNDNTGTEEHPPVQLVQLNLALNNNPLIITINQPIFVRNNLQPIWQYEPAGTRAENYRVYFFNGRKVEGKRFYITPRIRVYASEAEAREAAVQWSDAQTRNPQGQARYVATRANMYLVDEKENHFTFGGKTKRPLFYFFWPMDANTGHVQQNIGLFRSRGEALGAAQAMSINHVLETLPRNSADPLRPGFFHYPAQRIFEVRFKSPEGRRMKQRFKYNEERPSYESNEEARVAARDFMESVKISNTIPRPGQTFRMVLKTLLDIGHLVNRERFPFVFSPGLDFEERNVPIDPYYLGAWLGDGDRRNTGIANKVGPGIVTWLRGYATFLGMRVSGIPSNNPVSYHIVKDPNHNHNPAYVPEINPGFVYIHDIPNNYRANKVYLVLLALNVTRRNISGTGPATDLKHIPNIFKFNSRQVRLKMLAGLMDTDGSYSRRYDYFSFCQSATWHERLFDDLVFLARSLGFYCMPPFRGLVAGSGFPHLIGRYFNTCITHIYGDIDQVPCQVDYKQPRRRTKKRSHQQLSVRSFANITNEGAAEFFVLRTADNQPFLRDDFLVLLPSKNGQQVKEEEDLSDTSYINLLQDEEILPDIDEEKESEVMYSALQAASGKSEDPIEIIDMGEDEEVHYDEEFVEEYAPYDEEEELLRVIQESLGTAVADRAMIIAGTSGGESSTAARGSMPSSSGGPSSAGLSSAGPSFAASSSAASSSAPRQTQSRKGKEREYDIGPSIDPKRRRRE